MPLTPPFELESSGTVYSINHEALRLANRPVLRGDALYETHIGTYIKAPIATKWRLEIEINAYELALFSLTDAQLIDLVGRLLNPNQNVFVRKSSNNTWYIPNISSVVGSSELYVGLDVGSFDWNLFLRSLELKTVFSIKLFSLNLYATPFQLRRTL
jgi:hypothetical protein